MVNKMTNKIGCLISLNGEYLYSSAHGDMYAPLRVNKNVIQKIQNTIETQKPLRDSCVKTIGIVQNGDRFVLDTVFNNRTICTKDLFTTPSHQTKTEMCYKHLCNGKCTDDFMRNVVAKYILPELYDTKQK